MRLVSYGGGEDDDEVDVTRSDAEEDAEGEGGERGETEKEGEASDREDDVVSMDLGRDSIENLASNSK